MHLKRYVHAAPTVEKCLGRTRYKLINLKIYTNLGEEEIQHKRRRASEYWNVRRGRSRRTLTSGEQRLLLHADRTYIIVEKHRAQALDMDRTRLNGSKTCEKRIR